MNDDNDIFLNEMKGVSPIKKNYRVNNRLVKTNKKVEKKIKVETTITTPVNDKVYKKSEFSLEKLDIKKGIKRGFFKIDKKIDFHGKNLIESEEIFINNILECYNLEKRCLLFVTGKGIFKSKNPDNIDQPKLYYGVIRSEFVNWANSKKVSKHILSFEQASIEHGGDGAFYVYLRKKKN